jgi:cation:H+ antiporter
VAGRGGAGRIRRAGLAVHAGRAAGRGAVPGPPAARLALHSGTGSLTGLLLLALSAALLVAGAELFVENAAAAARRLGVTVLAVGLLLAGAEPEELLTAVIAALDGHPSLAVGDAIGANITMLTAALGLAALAAPLPFGQRVQSYAALSAAAGLLALAALADGRVSRVEGALLLAGYAALVGLVWWRERRPPMLGELAEAAAGEEGGGGDAQGDGRPPVTGLLLALAGVGIMLLGGSAAVAGATRVVAALGQSDTAIGLTLLALATTAELFALVWASARRRASEVAVAGVVGSAAYNATATLGAAALAHPLAVTGMTVPAAAAAALPLAVVALAWPHRRLGRPAGALLCAGYAAFLLTVLR